MRTEREMLELILATAQGDTRIRAVVITGSRTNPNARRDIFQDFDIVYLVTSLDTFTCDHSWIDVFGERMILQMPETMRDPPPSNDGSFTYLIQFTDGNRLDLSLLPVVRAGQLGTDSLHWKLLDKDGLLPAFAAPSDADYQPKPPNAQDFADCCNEFWWVLLSVAKGLWRQETTYAKHMLDVVVRAQLMRMLDWYVGINSGFSKGSGKFGKNLQQQLPPELWRMLEATYADASCTATWQAVEAMIALFRLTATDVARHCGLQYAAQQDANVSAHLRHVHNLPRTAQHLY